MKEEKNICCDDFKCKGLCWLNICGYLSVWEIVANKCKGTREERELIDSTFKNEENIKKVIEKYDFNENEIEKLSGEWY